MLPQLAQGEANKIWVIPTEFTRALGQIGATFSGDAAPSPDGPPAPAPPAPRPPHA